MVFVEPRQDLIGNAEGDLTERLLLKEQNLGFSAFLEQGLKYFERGFVFDNPAPDLTLELNQIYRQLVPRWHFAMLNDIERNEAFETAIKQAVSKDCTVLDVGTGSGLLAMMAARHGAHLVTSCEMCRPIAYLAKQIVALNGFESQIKIVPKKSQALLVGQDLPRQADLLVTETVDCGLVGEGILPIIRQARQSLLTKKARIIPARATLKFSLLESSVVHSLNFASHASQFDVSAFNIFSTTGYFPVRLYTWPYRLLSQATTAFEFDFAIDLLEPRQCQIPIRVEHSGTCHGIVFWFEMDLGHGVVLNNAPSNKKSHWMQAVQCFEQPVSLQQDALLELTIHQSDTSIDFQITKILQAE